MTNESGLEFETIPQTLFQFSFSEPVYNIVSDLWEFREWLEPESRGYITHTFKKREDFDEWQESQNPLALSNSMD